MKGHSRPHRSILNWHMSLVVCPSDRSGTVICTSAPWDDTGGGENEVGERGEVGKSRREGRGGEKRGE